MVPALDIGASAEAGGGGEGAGGFRRFDFYNILHGVRVDIEAIVKSLNKFILQNIFYYLIWNLHFLSSIPALHQPSSPQ